MRRIWVLWLILLPGCASVQVVPPIFPGDELARADGRVAEGCLSCLIDARDALRRLAAGPFRTNVLPALFETQLLLVLRHKELAMAIDAPLADARQTASALPEDSQSARYLSLVEAVAEDPVGATEAERGAFLRAREAFKARWATEVSWAEQGPLGRRMGLYLGTALRCTYSPPVVAPTGAARVSSDEVPLLIYRRAICVDPPNLDELEIARALVPDFQEALFYSARGWLADSAKYGFGKPAAAILEVLPRFSQSPSVTFTAAGIQRTRRLCPEALTLYDQTLALRPGHEGSVLGRTECLSRLSRHEEAIVEATTLIGLGGRTLPTAYYWRAWNGHHVNRLPAARQDIESAKRAQRDPDVNIPLLAGVIEYDQDDLDAALNDLRLALVRSRNRACLANWYIALVHIRRTNWAESAGSFDAAVSCYDQNIRDARRELATLDRDTAMAADFKVQRSAELNAGIVEDDTQKHNAAINGAKGFATVGNFDAAVRLGTIASEFTSLASEVQVLRDYLLTRKSPVQLPETVGAARQ